MSHAKKLNHKKRFIGGVLAVVMLCESVLANSVWSHAATQDSPGIEKAEVTTETESGKESAEDLLITSEYRLEQDMTVNNLTITAGSLDLNGYQLEVRGDIQHSYGAVYFHEGTLLCEGNYTMENRGYLSMQNSKDTLFVNGDFTVQSDESSYGISSGVIEIKGDFTQKTVNRKDNFVAGENHEVIFSGDRQQKIHFDSPVSHFNRVMIQNTSSEGIVTDGVVNAREIERNGVEITSPIQGSYGWTLQKDEVYQGDLVLLGDTLDLNGHTLSVSGSLIQMNGTVKINGGNLKVEDDYRIQSSANEQNEYSGASSWLYMLTPQDLVEVGGDFITESAIDHMGMLRDGTLAVGGDVVQKQYYYNGNFATSSGLVLRLCGSRTQRLDMRSKLSNLEVTNAEGVELIHEMYIVGNIADHGNPVLGKGVELQYGTTFADGSFQGTLIRTKRYKMPHLTYIGGDLDNRANLMLNEELTVCGNVINTELIDLDGNRMEVKGNIENKGWIEFYGGSLICDGDFYLKEYSCLSMDSDEDYMLVNGDFYAASKMGVPEFEGGTLELKGDLIHTTPSTTGNFRAAGTHRTIFSGTSKQLVQFADRYSYLNEVELLNTSEEGVYAPNGIPCKTLNTNGNRYDTDIPGNSGWTLQADEVFEGDLHLLSGKLDLNGHTLTVKGNFVQAGGNVEIHKGKLVVEGDYRIQSVSEQGGEKIYGASNGSLLMKQKEDLVIVRGSFVMGSVYSHGDKLTNGELKVAGNVAGVGYRAYDNLATSGEHVLTLNGSAGQTLSLSSPSFSRMRFANVRMENVSGEGVLLDGSVPVEGKIEIEGKAPKGTFQVKETTSFENGSYNGDLLIDGSQGIANLDVLEGNLTIKGNSSLNRDLTVTGTVSLEGGTLDLKGHCLTVGKTFVVQGAKATLSGKGVLALKGDFRQEGTETAFSANEDCNVVFCGTGLQNVGFESTSCYFHHVEITNTSEEGVYAENGIPCQYLETNGNVYRTRHEGSIGWRLSQNESYEGDLTLVSGTLDLQGHELTIKGNLIQKGGNVNVHGGTLRIEGDYVLGDVAGSGQNRKQTASWGVLQMQEAQDRVHIGGDFIMASSVRHSKSLINGEMHVAGNMTWLKTDSGEDSMTAGAFTLVLDGTARQTACMERGMEYAGIANLIVDNSCEQGVFFDGLRVPGSVLVKKGTPYGALHAGSGTEFLNECYPGDVTFDKRTVYGKPLCIQGSLECSAYVTLGADASVGGNFQCMEGADLNGHKLEIGRDVILCGGELRIQKGQLLCGGNLRQIYRPHESCGLKMTEEEDYVLVQGNMYVDSYQKSTMKKGTLELRGNFIQTQYGTRDAFLVEKTFVVIASGDKKQTIKLSAPNSEFGIFEVRNESQEGVYFDNESVRVSCLKRNGCQVSCKGGVFGWTLTEDMVLEEDLYLVADELNLNGHKLQVNGNIYAGGGSIRINGGELEVSGDIRFQSYDGHGTYSDSRAALIMSGEKERVQTDGDFVFQSNQDETGSLTAGTIEIKGAFAQIRDTQGIGKFVASGTHQMVFSGEKRQKITSTNHRAVRFANVDFSKSAGGAAISFDLPVSGTVKDLNQKAFFEKDSYMILTKSSQLEGGVFGGNIQWNDGVTLGQNLDILGSVKTSYNIDLHGYHMKAGGYIQENGTLSVNRGELLVSGNMIVGTNGILEMNCDEDRVLVEGDFQERSVQKHVLTAGELELKGDVEIQGEGFAAEGTHRTKCSGKIAEMGRIYVQNIAVKPAKARFAELLLTKDIKKYYAFSRDVESMCSRLTVQKDDMQAPSKVCGAAVVKMTSTTVQLSWEPSSDDKGVSSYEVYRNGSRAGATQDTKYTDIGLKPGQTYTYTVYAVDEAENVSEASEPLTVSLAEDTEPPTKPAGVKIVTRTGSAVIVGWDKSRDNAGVKGYRIFRDGEQLAEVDSETRQYKDVVRTPGKEHTYQICALDEAGNCSELSSCVTGSPQMPEIYSMTPENGEELGGDSVVFTLYYKNVGNSTGNRVRFQYRSDTEQDWVNINEVLIGQKSEDYMTLSSSYTWNPGKLPAGKYRVRAVLCDADGNQAETEYEYVLAPGAPKVPQKILAECDNGVNEVSWNPSDSANCIGYEVYRAEESGTFFRVQTLQGRNNISYKDREVTEGRTYLYYVKAFDRYHATSEASQTVSVTVTEDEEPPAVLSLTGERAKLSGEVVLTAKAVDNVEVKSIDFQYYAQEKWNDMGTAQAKEGVAQIRFDTKVLPDGTYRLRACAKDRSGNVGLKFAEEFEIDNTGVGKVTIYKTRADSDSIFLSWNPVPEEDIDFYVVEQWKDGAFEEVERTSGTLNADIENLDEDTEYRFLIVGYDDAGNKGEASDEICLSTKKDTTEPRLTGWKPVYSYFRETIPLEVSAKDNHALGQMKVCYSKDKKTWKEWGVTGAPVGSKEHTYRFDMDIRDLEEGMFHVKILLYDRAGNCDTETSAIRAFYKDVTNPNPPSGLHATAKDGFIKVEWEKPQEKDFESFDLFRKVGSQGSYERVTNKTRALNYFDTSGTEGQEIFYKLRINDQAGNTSEFSEEVSARVLPDTECPKVYGISPASESTVGNNPSFTTLVADNRALRKITASFRKQGSGDMWTEFYEKSVSEESIYDKFDWKNESLDEGMYEFRISAEDAKGNVSEEYLAVYTYDKSCIQEPSESEGTPEQEDNKNKLAAVLPEGFSVWQDSEKEYDGTDSLSGKPIISWNWDFGNGHTAEGARVIYAYPKEGKYDITLTVRDVDGNENSVTSSVVVHPKGSGGVIVNVKDTRDSILRKAQVYVQKKGEKSGALYYCDENGAFETALEDGEYEISAYIDGHLPKSKTIQIQDGHIRKMDFVLQKKEVVSGILSHHKLTPKEIIEKGVDLEDEDNWIDFVYEYEIYTYRLDEPSPKTYRFSVSGGKWSYVNGIAYTVISAGGKEILAEYEKGKYLKQMFEVKLRLRNHSDKKFVLTGGEAELKLPDGLSLAGMISGNKNLKLGIADIPGQSQAEATWYIRGDRPGEYHISAGYHGYLQPFNAPVSVTIQDKYPVVVTKEDGMSGSDDDFVDDDDETRYYQICVTNAKGNFVKYALVELSYGDASASAITDENGLAILEVNEGDSRTFCLTVTHKDYQTYEDKSYQINLGDYMDSVRIISKKKKSPYEDENKEYEGDFELKYVTVNGVDVSKDYVEINIYEDEKNKDKKEDKDDNEVRMTFNEKVSDVSIVTKDINGKEEKIVSKKNVSSKDATLTFKSSLLKKGCDMYVKAKDEETGAWHLYRLENVLVVYEEPEKEYETGHYNQKMAEQCALYSALAYKVIKGVNKKPTDGFSYDSDSKELSDRIDHTYEARNVNCIDLRQKLTEDGFTIDDDYMYINYYEGNEIKGAADNCSFSIVHRKMHDGKIIIYVVVRGTDRVEWFGNMEVTGKSYDESQEYHKNFKYAEKGVYKKLKEYITNKKLNDADIVVTGHSRGAAVANLLAEDLIDGKEEFNKSKQTKGSYDVVTAYTFATPFVTKKKNVKDERYSNIYNFCFVDDFVPQVPMKTWGYDKVGNTITADSEFISKSNKDFNIIREKIRNKDKSITYASKKTETLITHVSENWKDTSEYYNKKITLEPFPPSRTTSITLFEFMYYKIAYTIVEVKNDLVMKLPTIFNIAETMADMGELFVVSEYFVNGSNFIENYIFDTHNIDNYYAAIRSGGFNTASLKTEKKVRESNGVSTYLSSSNKENILNNVNFSDIQMMKDFLSKEIMLDSQKKTIAEVLGWNIDDTSTWDGVTFTGDRITAIDFPPVSIGGVLDLTGLDKLESLTCIYTGFENVILKGCTSLRELTLCDNEITDLDVRDCAELESVDVSDNQLKHIRWGTHESLTWLNCIGNYLDTDTDEELLTVIHTLQANGWNPSYKYQRQDENAEYSKEDISFVRQMLDDGENQKLLGWDKEDITTWDGVQWKTVAGVNYINRIDIARCGLTGTLTLSGLKYIREFVCEGNAFTELDATGCRTLEQLNCANCELETLKLEGTDNLLYLDCRNNGLSLDAIEEWCREIASREGSDVNYERQYINASREAFCEEECQELERFAGNLENKEELKWDFTRPGRIPQIIWELQDGIYHVAELDIIGPGIGGTLDLSGFTHLKRIKLKGTEICKVILPESLKEIEKNAFINCNHLEEITLPSKLTEIGDMAFYNCENLKRIELPESVQKIGREAFVNDEKLEEVIIKGNLLSIGDYAFAGCTNLKKVTFLGNAPEIVGEEVFNRAPDDFVIYYNEKAAGWDNEYWSQYPIKAGSGFEGENPETPAPPSEESPKLEELPAKPAQGEPGAATSGKPDGINDGKISISQEQGNASDNSKTGDKKYHVSKVKIQKIKQKKRMLTLTIKRNKKVSGYEVFIRKGRKGRFKVRRLKGWKKNRLTVKKLKKNNVYYIKVRAYKVIAGKKQYSTFTKCRKVRVK